MSILSDPIPSGPFQRWLNDLIAESTAQAVVERIGWTTLSDDAGLRRLYRYRYGRCETHRGGKNKRKGNAVVVPATHFSRAAVEDALHFAGALLEDVYPPEMYPALYEDIPLEPEMFCANCQDTCTPIRGICPWCDGGLLVRAA